MQRATPIQTAAAAVGAVFLLVGIAGFIPGITTNLYGGIEFAGNDSTSELLGIFQVSILHNLVHLGFGLAGLVLARSPRESAAFLLGGGVIYLVLWLYGLIVDLGSSANFIPLNNADNWLHLVLGAGMVGLGMALRRPPERASRTAGGPAPTVR